jgi:hypothetical protein
MITLRSIFKLAVLPVLIVGVIAVFGVATESADTSNFNITIVPAPQCFDGQDNDTDGLIDYPADPGCDSYTDDDETDVSSPPSGGGGGGGGGVSSGGRDDDEPDTSIKFSGRAYPGSQVSILQDGVVVLQTIAGSNAKFSATLGDLVPGNYNYLVRANDDNGMTSEPYTFPVLISQGSTTEVSGIFLAPTIDVDKTQVRRGDDIVIFGQTAPRSDVTIEVNSETQIFVATESDADGAYFYAFNSAPLEYGDHSTQSKTALSGGASTGFGRRVGFIVGDMNVVKEAGAGQCNADLNSDGRVNLIDFSIAAFWYQKTLSGDMINTEALCLNGDARINLVDFSIMAFYWTG